MIINIMERQNHANVSNRIVKIVNKIPKSSNYRTWVSSGRCRLFVDYFGSFSPIDRIWRVWVSVSWRNNDVH